MIFIKIFHLFIFTIGLYFNTLLKNQHICRWQKIFNIKRVRLVCVCLFLILPFLQQTHTGPKPLLLLLLLLSLSASLPSIDHGGRYRDNALSRNEAKIGRADLSPTPKLPRSSQSPLIIGLAEGGHRPSSSQSDVFSWWVARSAMT